MTEKKRKIFRRSFSSRYGLAKERKKNEKERGDGIQWTEKERRREKKERVK